MDKYLLFRGACIGADLIKIVLVKTKFFSLVLPLGHMGCC